MHSVAAIIQRDQRCDFGLGSIFVKFRLFFGMMQCRNFLFFSNHVTRVYTAGTGACTQNVSYLKCTLNV